MNKIKVEENKVKYFYDDTDNNYIYNLNKNEELTIYHYVVNASSKIIINLNGENAKVNYYYSNINYQDNTLSIEVNHNACCTTSNVYNHGVNINCNKLYYIVNGTIPKLITSCNCNQDSRIINITNGKSSIHPNLYIDNYDCLSHHAAYIGKFKDRELFYLMSRGITKKDSYSLLLKGFLLYDNNKFNKKLLNEIKKI